MADAIYTGTHDFSWATVNWIWWGWWRVINYSATWNFTATQTLYSERITTARTIANRDFAVRAVTTNATVIIYKNSVAQVTFSLSTATSPTNDWVNDNDTTSVAWADWDNLEVKITVWDITDFNFKWTE